MACPSSKLPRLGQPTYVLIAHRLGDVPSGAKRNATGGGPTCVLIEGRLGRHPSGARGMQRGDDGKASSTLIPRDRSTVIKDRGDRSTS